MRRAMSDEFPYVSPPKDPPPKVFISYATADKQIAGRIKLALSAIGVDAFLAHEDTVGASDLLALLVNWGPCP